jgi:hypothetical protein
MNRHIRRSLFATVCALLATPDFAFGEERASAAVPDADTAAQFVQRAENYVRMREQAAAEIPKLKETPAPEEIQAREKLLAAAIRTQRAGAKPGEIFGDARAAIVAAVRNDWRRRSAGDRAALLEETGKIPVPAVNSIYPPGVPIATFPPDLLTVLPVLPEQLEYRFAGTHLILLDIEANLVVDVVPSVLDRGVTATRTPAG